MKAVSRCARSAITVLICVVAMSGLMVLPQHAQAADSTEQIEMYRMYNRYSGEHFYTGSVTERDSLRTAGWNYEGVGWMAPEYSNIDCITLIQATITIQPMRQSGIF